MDHDIGIGQVEEMMKRETPYSYTLLDVRQDWEFMEFHLPGAALVPLAELADRITEVPSDQPVIAYCASGVRSLAATNLLRGQGFANVRNMTGGAMAWKGIVAEEGPDFGLDLLPAKASPEELVSLAYGMEVSLGEFYQACASNAEGDLKVLFSRLARFENTHRKMVEKLAERERLSINPDLINSDKLEGGWTREEFMVSHGSLLERTETVVEAGMAFEAQALDIYMRLSRYVADENTISLIKELANEEKEHLRQLAILFDNFASKSN